MLTIRALDGPVMLGRLGSSALMARVLVLARPVSFMLKSSRIIHVGGESQRSRSRSPRVIEVVGSRRSGSRRSGSLSPVHIVEVVRDSPGGRSRKFLEAAVAVAAPIPGHLRPPALALVPLASSRLAKILNGPAALVAPIALVPIDIAPLKPSVAMEGPADILALARVLILRRKLFRLDSLLDPAAVAPALVPIRRPVSSKSRLPPSSTEAVLTLIPRQGLSKLLLLPGPAEVAPVLALVLLPGSFKSRPHPSLAEAALAPALTRLAASSKLPPRTPAVDHTHALIHRLGPIVAPLDPQLAS
ncbi:hypothetical protein FRC06_007409 [Ceratobasidium sp. 370]|nr:hypothetical protein FRC06_007409 [Ceratobasidium sp. 370]